MLLNQFSVLTLLLAGGYLMIVYGLLGLAKRLLRSPDLRQEQVSRFFDQ